MKFFFGTTLIILQIIGNYAWGGDDTDPPSYEEGPPSYDSYLTMKTVPTQPTTNLPSYDDLFSLETTADQNGLLTDQQQRTFTGMPTSVIIGTLNEDPNQSSSALCPLPPLSKIQILKLKAGSMICGISLSLGEICSISYSSVNPSSTTLRHIFGFSSMMFRMLSAGSGFITFCLLPCAMLYDNHRNQRRSLSDNAT